MQRVDLIQLNHLSDAQREIADALGIETYRRLVANFGGEKLHIAKLDTIISAHREEIIRDNFNGRNQNEIQQALQCSIREIDRVISSKKLR